MNEQLVTAEPLRSGHWIDWPEGEHPPEVGDFVWQWDSAPKPGGFVWESSSPGRSMLHKVLAREWDKCGDLTLYVSEEDYAPR